MGVLSPLLDRPDSVRDFSREVLSFFLFASRVAAPSIRVRPSLQPLIALSCLSTLLHIKRICLRFLCATFALILLLALSVSVFIVTLLLSFIVHFYK